MICNICRYEPCLCKTELPEIIKCSDGRYYSNKNLHTRLAICKDCGKSKPLDEFSRNKRMTNGHLSSCKKCCCKYADIASKTKDGLITKMYASQRRHSKKRGHNPPTYTNNELKEWLFAQKEFHELYDKWKRLDYQKKYIPSVDRLDDYSGYSLSNIQITTWNENMKKGHRDSRNGINNKRNKAVIKMRLDGEIIDIYHSMNEAERVTGIPSSNISNCCSGKLNSAGGFLWSTTTNS